MKNRSISILIIVLMLASGLSTLAIGKTNTTTTQTIALSFAQATTASTTVDTATYTQLSIQGIDTTLGIPGAPAVPIKITVLELPFGTTVTNVQLTAGAIQTMTLPAPVIPAPQPVIRDSNSPTSLTANQAVYASSDYYPTSWFDYSTGAGLNTNSQHVTFLVIRTYPVRVSPATNTAEYIQNAILTVDYMAPAIPKTFGSNPDGPQLLIITPKTFVDTLQPLITEKTGHGINSTLLTLEDIYSTYTGYDKPEQIKYAIKAALENQDWNIHYVLLVGGMKGYLLGDGGRDDSSQGVKSWYFPVRYTNMQEAGTEYDPGFISDLYYADIYDANGSFSSWDSNGDHVYGGWLEGQTHDMIDLYPDVAVGRLAARTTNELKTLIDRIIAYEKQPADPSWFKNAILVGGDTDDDRSVGTDFNEGEMITSFSFNESLATSFTPIKIYVSNRNISNDFTPTPANIERELSKGAGWLFFDGHGNPLSWNTHWHDSFNWTRGNTPGGLNIYEMMLKVKNGAKLPVCIVGGCHNSMFNVSLFWTMNRKNVYTWCYGEPTPRCWSEQLMTMKNGGAIACIGSTALSYGDDGMLNGTPACYQTVGGFIERTFLQAYNASSTKTLGDCWSGSITRYLQVWPGMGEFADGKTVEEWATLGDPSLVIGGYS